MEKKMVHSQLELEYLFEAKDSFAGPTKERQPKIVMWTSLAPAAGFDGIKHKGLPHGPAFHRVILPEAKDLILDNPKKNPSIRVNFPYDPAANKKMSIGADVMALLMTKVKNSNGKWCYEQTASAQIPLADLMANDKQSGNPWLEVPMNIYSFYMPDKKYTEAELDTERHKGNLLIRLAGKSANGQMEKQIKWAKPTGYEPIPAHAKFLVNITGEAVRRNLSAVDPQTMIAASGKSFQTTENPLKPIHKQLNAVHAPLYMGPFSKVPIPGSWYWAMVPSVAMSHVKGKDAGAKARVDDYLANLVHQALKAHDMTPAEFIAASKSTEFQAGTNPHVPKEAVQKARVVLASASAWRASVFAQYVRDTVPLAGKAHRLPTVESFNELGMKTDDDRDSGGVTSWFVGNSQSAAASKYKQSGGRISTTRIAFAPPTKDNVSGPDSDCEDDARDSAVAFTLWKEKGIIDQFKHPINAAARVVAQDYRAVGVLLSVHHEARNLTDAKTRQSKGTVKQHYLGDPEDGQIGAHMMTLLVPEEDIRRGINKTFLAKNVHQKLPQVKVDYGTSVSAAMKHLNRSGTRFDKPILLLEGTGMLHPLPLAAGFYQSTDASRVEAMTTAAKNQEAEVRVRTGMSTRQLGEKGRKMPSDILGQAGFQTMHVPSELIDDPDTRLVGGSFYQTVSEMYLVPTLKQTLERLDRTTYREGRMSGDLMFAVQVGPRIQGGKYAAKPIIKPAKLQSGVDLADIMRKRDFVGFLPTAEPHPHELRMVEEMQRHMAPAVPLQLPTARVQKHYEASAIKYPNIFVANLGKMVSADRAMMKANKGRINTSPSPKVRMVHAYLSSITDTDAQSIQRLAKQLRQNPHVRGATLSLQRATYHMTGLRLDVAVDTSGDGMEQLPMLMGRLMENKEKELMLRASKSSQKYRTKSALSKYPPTTTTTAAVVNSGSSFQQQQQQGTRRHRPRTHSVHAGRNLFDPKNNLRTEAGWKKDIDGWIEEYARSGSSRVQRQQNQREARVFHDFNRSDEAHADVFEKRYHNVVDRQNKPGPQSLHELLIQKSKENELATAYENHLNDPEVAVYRKAYETFLDQQKTTVVEIGLFPASPWSIGNEQRLKRPIDPKKLVGRVNRSFETGMVLLMQAMIDYAKNSLINFTAEYKQIAIGQPVVALPVLPNNHYSFQAIATTIEGNLEASVREYAASFMQPRQVARIERILDAEPWMDYNQNNPWTIAESLREVIEWKYSRTLKYVIDNTWYPLGTAERLERQNDINRHFESADVFMQSFFRLLVESSSNYGTADEDVYTLWKLMGDCFEHYLNVLSLRGFASASATSKQCIDLAQQCGRVLDHALFTI